jgi:hypothetical protein
VFEQNYCSRLFYPGQAKIKKATSADGTTIEPVYTKKVFLSKKAVDMDIYFAGQLGDLGKSLYEQRFIKKLLLYLRSQPNKESKVIC